jgi:RNA polymerase sigma factor (sigma-70 family)
MEPVARSDAAALVERAVAGDVDAWTDLVVEFQDVALALALTWTRDWDTARDVAQEAFVVAIAHLGELRDAQAFPAWFATVVRTACRRHARRSARVPAVAGNDLDEPDPDAGPLAAAVLSDEQQRLRAAVEGLPDAERAVVALHYFAGLTYPQVADFLGITPAAAKKRAFSARRRLQEVLPMATETFAAKRPSNSTAFRDTILLFAAIRRRDRVTVARLLANDPSLVDATEAWTWDEALASGLNPAQRGTPLVRAVETGDVELVRVVLAAGASVGDACACAGGENALWTATVFGHAALVDFLLEAGAAPDAAAFAGATPLHAAVQRGRHDLVRRLLRAGADPSVRDDHGRTPSEWASLRRTEPALGPHAAHDTIVPTGIRAIDLFAPVARGGVQYWPPAVSLGQTVCWLALCDGIGVEPWCIGFEIGPFSEAGARHGLLEAGMTGTVRYATGNDATARRSAFARVLAEVAASPGPKVVVCQDAPGHAHDILVALPGLAADPSVVTTIVVEPHVGTPVVTTVPPEGFSSQVAFDGARARLGWWPAIDPRSTTSRRYPSERHEHLATVARRTLAEHQADDPELRAPAGVAGELLAYFVQPFRLWEPFSSRPGEATGYDTLLDDVERIVTP